MKPVDLSGGGSEHNCSGAVSLAFVRRAQEGATVWRANEANLAKFAYLPL